MTNVDLLRRAMSDCEVAGNEGEKAAKKMSPSKRSLGFCSGTTGLCPLMIPGGGNANPFEKR